MTSGRFIHYAIASRALEILDIFYYFLSFKGHKPMSLHYFILHITCTISTKVGSVAEWYKAQHYNKMITPDGLPISRDNF